VVEAVLIATAALALSWMMPKLLARGAKPSPFAAAEQMQRHRLGQLGGGEANVRLEGRVVLDEKPLKSPITARECAFFDCSIDRLIPPDRNQLLWHNQQAAPGFWLQDGAQLARIVLEDAEVHWRDLGEPELLDGRINPADYDRMRKLSGMSNLATASYHEIALLDETAVTVVGSVEIAAGSAPGETDQYRTGASHLSVRARLVLFGSPTASSSESSRLS
jgi:hypothetical protein